MSLKGTYLQEYNPDLPEQEKDTVLSDNFKALRRSFGSTGVKNIVSLNIGFEQSVASSTAKTFDGLSKAFRSSNGFVEIEFSSVVRCGAAFALALYLDNRRMDMAVLSVAHEGYVRLFWSGNLNGKHVVDVRGNSNGAAPLYIASTNSNARLTVKETLI